jgi:hypothetical protein
MFPADIKLLLERFVGYVTTPGEKRDEALLELCDRIVAAYHQVNYTFDNRAHPESPRPDSSVRRATISALFPHYGYYCLTSSNLAEFPADAVVGDAIDDLSDLSRDFEAIIWCFDHTSVDDALWHFHNGYWVHLGAAHARVPAISLSNSHRHMKNVANQPPPLVPGLAHRCG